MVESSFPTKAKMAVSVLLLIGGLAVYWVWALTYNAWNPVASEYIGVYAVSSVMVLFGIFGILLARRESSQRN